MTPARISPIAGSPNPAPPSGGRLTHDVTFDRLLQESDRRPTRRARDIDGAIGHDRSAPTQPRPAAKTAHDDAGTRSTSQRTDTESRDSTTESPAADREIDKISQDTAQPPDGRDADHPDTHAADPDETLPNSSDSDGAVTTDPADSSLSPDATVAVADAALPPSELVPPSVNADAGQTTNVTGTKPSAESALSRAQDQAAKPAIGSAEQATAITKATDAVNTAEQTATAGADSHTVKPAVVTNGYSHATAHGAGSLGEETTTGQAAEQQDGQGDAEAGHQKNHPGKGLFADRSSSRTANATDVLNAAAKAASTLQIAGTEVSTPTTTAHVEPAASSTPVQPPATPSAQGITNTAAAPSANAAPEPEPRTNDANMSRIVRGIQGVVRHNGGSVTIRLDPPELGAVRVQMHMNAGVVTARLEAAQQSVRSMLNQQLGQLRHALESQGLTVDRLQVQASAADTGASATGRDTDQNAHDGRSRGGFTPQGQQGDPDQHQHDQEPDTAVFDRILNMVA